MVEDYNGSLARLLAGLESSGLPYALGGAGAVAVWGIPRATAAIDITVGCHPSENEKALAALCDMGIELDPQRALEEIKTQGVVYRQMGGDQARHLLPVHSFL